MYSRIPHPPASEQKATAAPLSSSYRSCSVEPLTRRPSAEVNRATVAFRPRSQAVLGPAPPWSLQKDRPPTQSQAHARHVRRRSARAAWGPHLKVPVAAPELPSRASLSLLAILDTPLCPGVSSASHPGPFEHLLEKDTSGDEICALGQRFPRPPERFQTRPLLGPPRARASHLLPATAPPPGSSPPLQFTGSQPPRSCA